MGAEPTIGHEVGQRVPKFGVVSKNSQKFFNRKRDQAMREGSLRLSHEEPEIVQHRGIKIVDKSGLSAFVLNAQEKQHMADPDSNRLFTQKLRVPSSRQSEAGGESVALTLFEDARPAEQRREVQKPQKNNKKNNGSRNLMTQSHGVSAQFNTNSRSYLDNYRNYSK